MVPGGEGSWLLPSRFGGFASLPVFLARGPLEACTRGSARRAPVLCGERPALTGRWRAPHVNREGGGRPALTGKVEGAPR